MRGDRFHLRQGALVEWTSTRSIFPTPQDGAEWNPN